MDSPGYRNLVAAVGAQEFILSLLLKQMFSRLTRDQRQELAEMMIAAARKTDQFHNLTKGDDIAAERLSDTVILTQERVEKLVREAVAACATVVGDQ